MLTGNVPDVICTFDNDANDSTRTRTDVSVISEKVLWSWLVEWSFGNIDYML